MADASNPTDKRIARLEGAMALPVLLFAVTIAWASFMPESHGKLSVESLQLLTAEGDIVATLGSRDGYPVLALTDEKGVERVRLFHDAEGSGMYVSDESGTTRIGIAQFAHGGGGVALHGAESRGALVMYFKEAGSLRIFDHDGNVLRELAAADPRQRP